MRHFAPAAFRQLLPACLLGLLAGAATAQEARVSAALSPEVAGLDEAVKLEITVEGPGLQNLHFDANFQLENFRRVGGPAQGTSIRITNGRPSTSRSLTWYLQPMGVGEAAVRSIVVELGSDRLELEDRSVEVQEEIPAERRARRQDPFDRFFQDPFEDLGRPRRRPSARREAEPPQIFLRAEAEPRKPYVGQQVLYTLYLFTQADVGSVHPDELPDFKGFWVQEVPQPEQREPEWLEVEGERIGRVILLQRALFPRREGSYELEPVVARMIAKMPERGPFGPFFSRPTQIARESNRVRLDVKPLPPQPDGFEGAVGRLDLKAELEPRELEVGEAATLTLTLEGRGHLQGIAEPRLAEVPGLEVFPPQEQSRQQLKGTRVHGRRVWSFVLVPQRPGEIELPAVAIPYFDPWKNRYETAAADGLGLVVRGLTALAREGGETLELHPIRTAALPASGGDGGWSSVLPWIFALPWVLALGLVALRWRRGGGGGASSARRHLVERLREASAEEQPRLAAAAIEDAWRGYLEERWKIAPGTPSPRWSRLLAEKGVDGGTAAELVKLADDLHYLRYAPKLASTADLRSELFERSRKLVRALG